MEITQEFVKILFDYEDGFLFWKISLDRRISIGQKAAIVNRKKTGSRYTVSIKGKNYFHYRLIFLWHKGYLPKEIDHENRNSLDDRIENLRSATRSQNTKNRCSAKNSSSKYLGVRKRKDYVAWEAYISSENKIRYLGVYKSEDKAALAYNRAAVLYHKEFANLNIIQP